MGYIVLVVLLEWFVLMLCLIYFEIWLVFVWLVVVGWMLLVFGVDVIYFVIEGLVCLVVWLWCI